MAFTLARDLWVSHDLQGYNGLGFTVGLGANPWDTYNFANISKKKMHEIEKNFGLGGRGLGQGHSPKSDPESERYQNAYF